MIAIAKPSISVTVQHHQEFLVMLSAISRRASFSFRATDPETRADLIQEVIANAFVAYVRLVELGKAKLAYPTVLARYGVVQVRRGRRIGSRTSSNDVLSQYAQHRRGFAVESLDQLDNQPSGWQQIVVEDATATPADIAACRIDFRAWLQRLSRLQRRIAKLLATGETTSAVAKKFQLTNGRISQLRKELRASWEAFQGGAGSAN